MGPSSKGQNFPGHQRAASTQENYPGMQTGFQGMHQNHQMRRSMDNYIQLQNFNNQQIPFQQSVHLNSSNFNNNSKLNPQFGRSQIMGGGPSGSMDKLSKQQQQQTPSQVNNTKKIRRKRDFSQVIDPTQNQQKSAAQGNNSHTNSPSKVSGNKLNQTGPH